MNKELLEATLARQIKDGLITEEGAKRIRKMNDDLPKSKYFDDNESLSDKILPALGKK